MSNPVIQTVSQALTGVGYNTFAIASGPDASRQAVALYHHTDFRSPDLPIDGWALFRSDANDAPSSSRMNDASSDRYLSLMRMQYNSPDEWCKWGNIELMRISSKNLQKITLTVDASQPRRNLPPAMVAALSSAQAQDLNRLKWSLSVRSFSLAETAVIRSSLMAFKAHWNSESVQGPEIIYYPVYRDPALFASAAEMLSDIFGVDQVELHGE